MPLLLTTTGKGLPSTLGSCWYAPRMGAHIRKDTDMETSAKAAQ